MIKNKIRFLYFPSLVHSIEFYVFDLVSAGIMGRLCQALFYVLCSMALLCIYMDICWMFTSNVGQIKLNTHSLGLEHRGKLNIQIIRYHSTYKFVV